MGLTLDLVSKTSKKPRGLQVYLKITRLVQPPIQRHKLDVAPQPDTEVELDAVNPDVRHLPVVLSVRLEIYLRQESWERVVGIAARLIQNDPLEPQWPLSYAYATRRAQTLEAAKAILLEAIRKHPGEPMIPFNLACYECQLGNLDVAKSYLKVAFAMEPKMRTTALNDPDLKPLWDSLATETA